MRQFKTITLSIIQLQTVSLLLRCGRHRCSNTCGFFQRKLIWLKTDFSFEKRNLAIFRVNLNLENWKRYEKVYLNLQTTEIGKYIITNLVIANQYHLLFYAVFFYVMHATP